MFDCSFTKETGKDGNRKSTFRLKVSAVAVAVLALLALGWLTGENTAAFIPKLFGG